MRRLVSRQVVTLNLDGDDEGIECQVRSVAGPVALLDRVSALAPETKKRLTPGSFCLMAFADRGALVGLRGVATAASEDLTELAFVVADGVQVEERRVAGRVPLVTRARICSVTDSGTSEPSTETFTADLSLGGALVGRRAGLGEGPRFRLELFFSGDRTPLVCEAQLARKTRAHLGLRFTDVEPIVRVRLAGLLAAHQLRSTPTR